MTLAEYLSNLKSKRNLTLTQIAEISGVPFGTVQRIMSGSTENPAFQAVVDVIKALGGSVDVYAGIASESEKPSQEDRVIDIYSRIVRDQNKKIIALFSLLAFLVVGAVLLIIYDIRHGNIGYIRYAAAEMRRTWLWLK